MPPQKRCLEGGGGEGRGEKQKLRKQKAESRTTDYGTGTPHRHSGRDWQREGLAKNGGKGSAK